MEKTESVLDAARRLLAAGDAAKTLDLADSALRSPSSPEEAVSIRSVAARAARALGDLALEIGHLEAAEELAQARVPGSLGGARLQLGLALLRRGDAGKASKVLADAVPLLGDDPEAAKQAKVALDDAKVRALGQSSGVVRGPARSADAPESPARASGSKRQARALVQDVVARILEQAPDLSFDELLASVIDQAVLATKADRGFVLLAEPDGLKIRVARDSRKNDLILPHAEVSFSIAREAALEGRTILVVRPSEDPRFASSKSARRLGLKAVCAVPLRHDRQSLGVVILDRSNEGNGRGFDPEAELVATLLVRGVSSLILLARRLDALKNKTEALPETLAAPAEHARRRFDAGAIVGGSESIRKLLRLLDKVSPTDARVLIVGESGTGKELVARAIHANGARAKKPFVAVNCGAIAENLVEAELFGHVKGAFTDGKGAPGLIRQAEGGTLFLDEVADAPPKLQGALLRFLEEREVRPVGGEVAHKVDVRVLSATRKSLEGPIGTGSFRADLFHRLSTITVHVPPLRERLVDIPLLVEHFAREVAERSQKRVEPFPRKIIRALQRRPWEGNVRELKNAVEHFASVGKLPAPVRAALRGPKKPVWSDARENVPTLRDAECRTIQAALRATGGNKLHAAKVLGISRRGLYYLLVDHGIDITQQRGKRPRRHT